MYIKSIESKPQSLYVFLYLCVKQKKKSGKKRITLELLDDNKDDKRNKTLVMWLKLNQQRTKIKTNVTKFVSSLQMPAVLKQRC